MRTAVPDLRTGPAESSVRIRQAQNLTAVLRQDSHAVHEPKNLMEAAIGREVRALRRRHGMTVIGLASAACISVGMVSRIENGTISASLTTLQALALALAVPLTSLLQRFEKERHAAFVKCGAGVEISRGAATGRQNNLLGYIGARSRVSIEPYLTILTKETDPLPLFRHAGVEFLYMLEGEIIYRHGSRLYPMLPGDSLFFDADAPHGPNKLTKLPIRFLSIVSYRLEGTED
ncbi:helix-turn-helix domain-containing protein [Mesorhizobium sp. A556]